MVRHDVLRYLQTAWNKPPGVDLQQGEVAVIQVRDEIADRMYDGYYEDEKRQDFLLQVWPIVCLQISKDNRVRKVSRVIDGSRRALWIWTAPPAGENAMQS
ncbi:expressed unknown protein [Seminavis robusta]|nr:expressed unknown protein [Seminavis robusta]|eukprot:Sro1354_g265450.1 n/a (101) ;mRNA; r:30556-30858